MIYKLLLSLSLMLKLHKYCMTTLKFSTYTELAMYIFCQRLRQKTSSLRRTERNQQFYWPLSACNTLLLLKSKNHLIISYICVLLFFINIVQSSISWITRSLTLSHNILSMPVCHVSIFGKWEAKSDEYYVYSFMWHNSKATTDNSWLVHGQWVDMDL